MTHSAPGIAADAKYAAHAEAPDHRQRQQRSGNGSGGIHRLNQAVGGPSADLSTDSATITSRAVPRTPLAKRSEKRIPRICHHEETSANTGFTALATKYPPTTMGLRCETLSVT